MKVEKRTNHLCDDGCRLKKAEEERLAVGGEIEKKEKKKEKKEKKEKDKEKKEKK